MKHFYTFLLLLFTNYAAAQKPLVLIEEFTNTGCNPCAAWSPTLDQVINERLGDCIAIKYHSVYPDNGDEFYNYDPTAQQTRIDFYGVDGVPATYVNGTVIGERTYEMMNTAIDHFLSQPARYVLSVSKTIVNHQLSVNVAVTPQGSEDPSHLRLFVAAIEEYLIPTRPCNNGETELQYTLRKLLTGGGALIGVNANVATAYGRSKSTLEVKLAGESASKNGFSAQNDAEDKVTTDITNQGFGVITSTASVGTAFAQDSFNTNINLAMKGKALDVSNGSFSAKTDYTANANSTVTPSAGGVSNSWAGIDVNVAVAKSTAAAEAVVTGNGTVEAKDASVVATGNSGTVAKVNTPSLTKGAVRVNANAVVALLKRPARRWR